MLFGLASADTDAVKRLYIFYWLGCRRQRCCKTRQELRELRRQQGYRFCSFFFSRLLWLVWLAIELHHLFGVENHI